MAIAAKPIKNVGNKKFIIVKIRKIPTIYHNQDFLNFIKELKSTLL